MRIWMVASLALVVVSSFCAAVPAQQERAESVAARSVADIAQAARRSLVVINTDDRDGARRGVGTGFAVARDGLIATNLHVIGEGRSFGIETADGKPLRVLAVEASDRHLDLALVRVDLDPGESLPPLPLEPAAELREGQAVVVMGNPLGLKYSVVSGVVSGRREVEGRRMIQVAIPIEPGNSGGPVLDMQGRVRGIVTLKSLLSDNLGFAVEMEDLQRLLDRPNPVPIERWLTIGALDPDKWETRFGATWRQRGGRLSVQGSGAGFGGRALCLSKFPPPEAPYEVGVYVKLDEEAGAAGLAFHSDGNQRHYGFYPSGGRLRLSRFDGPDVFRWNVLVEQPSPHYRPGQWNHLKVRVEPDRLRCFVNDQLVIESTDRALRAGRVGLAKFRDTAAEFKGFRVAETLPPSQLDRETVERLAGVVEGLAGLEALVPGDLEPLVADADTGAEVLRRRAAQLEARAHQLRRLADDVHVRGVVEALLSTVGDRDAFDLLEASLLVARLDQHELEVAAYVAEVDQMAGRIRRGLADDADAVAIRRALHRFLFDEYGFHGSRDDYYHPANSHLNRVIDDREGLPITLAVLYMELGQRLGLQIEGVGLPGHFLVRQVVSPDEQVLIDVFDRGRELTRGDAARLVREHAGTPLVDAHLRPVSDREIVLRILANLLAVAQRRQDQESMLRYLDARLALDPDSVQDRGMRAVVRFETGRRGAAVSDLDWFLDNRPDGLDLDRVARLREFFLQGAPPAR